MREIVTFDAYGTLVDFQLGPTTLKVLADRLGLDGLDVDEFLDDFLVIRFEAVPTFGPFPEVPDALRALKSRYEIAIISNTDDELIAQNIANIGVEFDHVITAQQAKAYKPDRQTFEHAYQTIGVDPSQVIHTAQGWEYDLIPTRDLGLKRRVWINRYGRPGSTAYQPYD